MGEDVHENARVFKRPRTSNSAGSPADWMQADAQLIRQAVAEAGKKRCALRFGYTRDLGAYAVGVYAGTDYFTDYIRPSEDIDGYLTDLVASLSQYEPSDEASQRLKKRR